MSPRHWRKKVENDPTGVQQVVDGLSIVGAILVLAKDEIRLRGICNNLTSDEVKLIKPVLEVLKGRMTK